MDGFCFFSIVFRETKVANYSPGNLQKQKEKKKKCDELLKKTSGFTVETCLCDTTLATSLGVFSQNLDYFDKLSIIIIIS